MEPFNFFKPLHSWEVNDFEVRLLQNNDSLEYETVDKANFKTISKGLFDLGDNTSEQMVSSLKECRVMIGTDGETSFLRPFHTLKLDNYDIYLVEGADDLIWDIFCNSTKSSSFHSLKTSTIPSTRCHPETVAIIEKIKNECLKDPRQIIDLVNDFKIVQVIDVESLKTCFKRVEDDLKTYFKRVEDNLDALLDFKLSEKQGLDLVYETILCWITLCFAVHPVNMFLYSAYCRSYKIGRKTPNKFYHIEIEPKITAPSVIDSRVLVSKFTWAVTLVSNKGKICVGGKPNEFSYGNHAEIYIEGINEGFYNKESILIRNANPVGIGEKFLHLAHYLPVIESGLFSPDNFKYEKRTEVWMVTSDKVKVMLQNIEAEKTFPKGQRHDYNMLGEGSYIGKKGHNCFTWARYHLKTIGIDLKGKEMPPSLAGLVAGLITDYTKKPTKYTETPIQGI